MLSEAYEERECFLFVIITITRIATVKPYTLGFTVASDGLRNHIGSLLGGVFVTFLQFSLNLVNRTP